VQNKKKLETTRNKRCKNKRYEQRFEVRTKNSGTNKGRGRNKRYDGWFRYSKTTRKKKIILLVETCFNFPVSLYKTSLNDLNYPVIGEPKCTLAAHANLGVLGSSSLYG